MSSMGDTKGAEVGGEMAVTTNATGVPTCACKGPNPGYEVLTDARIDEEFATLNPSFKWSLSEDRKLIARKFVCRDWQAAVNAIIAVGQVAEDVKHHPDVHLTNYRDVEVVIQTHSIRGLTNFDFILARGIDAVEIDYSPKWKKDNLDA